MNGQTSSGNNIEAALPQNFIRLPLLFLIYRNNLFDKLAFKPKHFLKTSLFFVVQDLTTKTKDLNNGLNQIKNSNNFPWKMNFIPDPSKQAPEVTLPQVPLNFYHTVSQTDMQIHLGMLLDMKLVYNNLQFVCLISP